jgi:hypothetical protein
MPAIAPEERGEDPLDCSDPSDEAGSVVDPVFEPLVGSGGLVGETVPYGSVSIYYDKRYPH